MSSINLKCTCGRRLGSCIINEYSVVTAERIARGIISRDLEFKCPDCSFAHEFSSYQ